VIDLAVRHFALPLRHPFTISRGTVEVQDTVIVQLHEDGCFGYGEATTNPYYGATVESLSRRMSDATPLLRGVGADDLDAMLTAIRAAAGDDMFACCALDAAVHDLWARRQGLPLHRLWGLDPAAGPASATFASPRPMPRSTSRFPSTAPTCGAAASTAASSAARPTSS